MDNARKLGEKNWRNAARKNDGWQKLLKKAWAQIGLLCQCDDEVKAACRLFQQLPLCGVQLVPHRGLHGDAHRHAASWCHLFWIWWQPLKYQTVTVCSDCHNAISSPDTGYLHHLAHYILLLKALQLQRSFGLLNDFIPFGSVLDAVLPCFLHHSLHHHPTYFRVFLVILLTWVSIHILFLPFYHLARDVRVRTKLIFVFWCDL
jgi:hypothetical protein